VDEYQEMAARAGEMWIDHGALEYFEGVGDDLTPDMGDETVLTFPELARTAPDETVMFAFIVYRSKEHRDEVNAAVMAEMDGRDDVPMPFDTERLACGGFRSLVSLGRADQA
jgi:uncharacterized protein YbaA (DUF1428 family)